MLSEDADDVVGSESVSRRVSCAGLQPRGWGRRRRQHRLERNWGLDGARVVYLTSQLKFETIELMYALEKMYMLPRRRFDRMPLEALRVDDLRSLLASVQSSRGLLERVAARPAGSVVLAPQQQASAAAQHKHGAGLCLAVAQSIWQGGNNMHACLLAAIHGSMIPSCIGEIDRPICWQVGNMMIDHK